MSPARIHKFLFQPFKMSDERKKKNHSSRRFGEEIQQQHLERERQRLEEEVADATEATWGEVAEMCCTHSVEEWGLIVAGCFACCFFLYFFLFGLNLLGDSAKILGGCRAGELFGDDTNPISGLMIGILATVLLQSSSTTTSIVVSLVGSVVSVDTGIYMIMGANIGTSVTNTIVAMGHVGNGDALERAFSGAVVHDLFNMATVCILLPIEIITGYLSRLTAVIVKGSETEKGEKWEGPVKKLVSPLSKKLIIANKSVIKGVANGGSCDDYYPINCTAGFISYNTCKAGLIGCDSDTDECPAFFDEDASEIDDRVSGGMCFFISMVVLFICLAGLVTTLQRMLLGVSTRVIYKATNVNGYLAILMGTGLTILVQSSSITTSVLTPLVGMGVLRLEQMFPLTLGANIGTTMTAIMSAMVTDGSESLQVALAHLFFNLTGITIWYPIPFMREIPLRGARQLGKATRVWRGFPVVYIIIAFFIVPVTFLGVSHLYEQKKVGLTILAVLVTIILTGIVAKTLHWLCFPKPVDESEEEQKEQERKEKKKGKRKKRKSRNDSGKDEDDERMNTEREKYSSEIEQGNEEREKDGSEVEIEL